MLGSIIGTLGSIYLSSKQAEANNRAYDAQMRNIRRQKSEDDNRYNRLRYADTTQLAENSAALTHGLDTLRRSVKAAQGNNAVAGGTQSSLSAAKEQANRAYSDMIREIAANGSRYHQALDTQKETSGRFYLGKENEMEANRLAGRTAALNVANKAFEIGAKGLDGAESDAFKFVSENSSDWFPKNNQQGEQKVKKAIGG